MSDLWDYDDDDGDQGNGGGWEVPFPGGDDLVVEFEAETHKKRKGGRKLGRHGKADKRRAVSPPTSLAFKPLPTTILLDEDDDDDDDLVMLPSPVAATGRGGTAGPSGTAADRNPEDVAAAPTQAVSNLNPATRETLAREQELLLALQQVTECEGQLNDDPDPPPLPSVSRLPRLGFPPRLHTGRPPAPALGGGAAGTGTAGYLDDGDVILTADVPAPVGAAAHMAYGAPEATGTDDVDDAAAVVTAAAAAPAADRVQLKLVWGRDKDECLKMRVVKTDPFSKMVEKFREIAKQRSLCRDPNKIKFLFDGDDLAKMPGETPESLDMEDDMMIDVKL